MSDLYEVVTEELVTALAKAQAEFPAIAKAHINPHYKSKYADLGDVMAAVRPVLAKHGIFTSQPIRTMEGTTYLSTVLYGHGGCLVSDIPLVLEGVTPQQLGSTLTYYRRYCLGSMVGVVAEEDDDGNAARPTPPARTEPVEAADLEQSREALREAIADLPDADKELVKTELRNKRVPALTKPGATRAQLDELVDFVAGLKLKAEPFDLEGAEPVPPRDDNTDKPFTPTTFDQDLRGLKPDVRKSVQRGGD